MEVLLFLLLAHLLYDFHWQGPFVAEMKAKSNFIMAIHSLTWALLLYAVMWFFHLDALWQPIFLAFMHCVVDIWKVTQKQLNPMGAALWIDQGLHLFTIVALWIGAIG